MNKKLNVLVDCHFFDYKTTEGVNSYIKGLYESIFDMNLNINYYLASNNIDKLSSIFGAHDNVFYVKLEQNNKYIRLLFEFPFIVKKHKIDVAHFQYIAPLFCSCKKVVTLHDILFKDFPHYFPFSYRLVKNLLFKLSAKRADLLLTVSEYSKERISHYYNISKNKIIVTPNGVSGDFLNLQKNTFIFDKFNISKYILYVSRFEPRKNHIALLEAYLELRLWEKDVYLVMIGRETIEVSEFNELINSLDSDIMKFILIKHNVDYSELLEWYANAALFIYPSKAEGFGIPPIEAAAAGVRCICSNSTAMGDFNFFEDTLIDIDDSTLLKDQIIKLLSNSNPATISNVRNIIKKNYSWIEVSKKYYNQITLLKN